MSYNLSGLPNTNLQPGMTGPQVLALQNWLVQNGLMTQAQLNSGPGIYGPQTTAAVASLQSKLGVDNSSGVGYFGPRTIQAVQSAAAQPAPQQNAPAPNLSISSPSMTMANSTPAYIAPTPAPAAAPTYTAPAQTQNNQTPAAAPAVSSAPAGGTPSSSGGGAFPTANLQPGDTGTQVQQLQQWLVANGYMTQAQMNTGPGTYGPQTTAAVAALQKDLGVDNSSGVGYWGPRTMTAVQGALSGSTSGGTQGGSTGAGTGTGSGTGTGTSGTGITFTPTGDSGLDQALQGIVGVANGLVSNGYTIPTGLQITPALVSQFLTYAHQAVDPYTQQLISSRLSDINSSLSAMSTAYNNSVGEREQQFGSDLATEQNTAGASGTAFSGQRGVNEGNLAATANRDLSTLGVNAAYNIGSAARSAASDVGAANAGGINLPTLANGSVSLAGGQRGSTGTSGPLSYNYNPSTYTVGTIPSNQTQAVNQQQQSYISQYGTLAGAQSNSGRSVGDLIGMISGLPSGYTVPSSLT